MFAAAGLRPYVRVTPFSQPPGLDAHLAAVGMERLDDTRVMVLADPDGVGAKGDDSTIEAVEAGVFAEWIGRQRGSNAAERRAHADRLANAPVPPVAVLRRDAMGAVVACGQMTSEGTITGLYDVFTAPRARGEGHAEAVCQHLLRAAVERGAQVAYLQVDAANTAARRLYARMGFVDAYAYHYRSPRRAT